ncbi:MAG TPA: hypothetical protein DD979_08870 [Gammaproteobacteria bacterium]|nr:hypothetical protein [Gammaproteobacteria bacterium]
MGLWQTELYLLSSMNDVEALAPWFHLTRIGMFLAPVTMALLTWHICGASSQWFKRLVLMPGFIGAAALALVNNTLMPSVLVPAQSGFLPQPDAIHRAFLVIFFLAMLGSLILAFIRRRVVPERERRRINWLLISLGWISAFSLASIAVAAQVGAYLSGLLGALSNAVFVFVLLYATINHHLTDAGSALSALFARVLAVGFTLGLYVAVTQLGEQWLQGNSLLVFSAIFLILAMEAYPHILRLVQPGTRKLILSGGYDVYSVKRATQRAFKRSIEMDDLRAVLDHYLKGVMLLERYEFLLVRVPEDGSSGSLRRIDGEVLAMPSQADLPALAKDGSQLIMIDEAEEPLVRVMRDCEAIVCLPLFYEGRLMALLVVGPSLSYKRSYFRYDDIQLLQWLMTELPATLSRIIEHDALIDDLDEAQKTMSLIELMNQYHHDIKAPLSIIDGVVSNDLYDREKQHRIILEQVARGTQLVSMMSSILRGQRERQTKPVTLEHVIRGCIVLFERDLSDVHFEMGDLPAVVGDINDLKILFINLIKNSVEAQLPNRPLTLTVAGGQTNDRVWVSLRDNGCGMSIEQQRALWSQADSQKATGSGVGLRAVKRIVDEHRATIEVASEPGHGTTFTLGFAKRIELSEHVRQRSEFKRLQ